MLRFVIWMRTTGWTERLDRQLQFTGEATDGGTVKVPITKLSAE